MARRTDEQTVHEASTSIPTGNFLLRAALSDRLTADANNDADQVRRIQTWVQSINVDRFWDLSSQEEVPGDDIGTMKAETIRNICWSLANEQCKLTVECILDMCKPYVAQDLVSRVRGSFSLALIAL